jgi:hypothetical protein
MLRKQPIIKKYHVEQQTGTMQKMSQGSAAAFRFQAIATNLKKEGLIDPD